MEVEDSHKTIYSKYFGSADIQVNPAYKGRGKAIYIWQLPRGVLCLIGELVVLVRVRELSDRVMSSKKVYFVPRNLHQASIARDQCLQTFVNVVQLGLNKNETRALARICE
uniref:Uncharacterized protein n=1 Tax=Cacopsylla melanoneura TaxID=428564 RepID=A0A8D9E7J5_9HEMI